MGITQSFHSAKKASGSELDTGTDESKYASAKALKDSHNVPSVVPSTSGNVLTSDGTDWVSSTIPAVIAAGSAGLMTGSDKTKLDGIASGAQVNNISDVNATDLTDGGETTLHTHAGGTTGGAPSNRSWFGV